MHFIPGDSGVHIFDMRPWPQVSRWDVAQHLQGLRQGMENDRASLTTEEGAGESQREPSVLVSWAPGRLLGLGSPILPVGSADTSERHGVSQLTVQDRDVPGPLKSQGKVHVPIL